MHKNLERMKDYGLHSFKGRKKKKKAESKFREKGVGIPKLSILELESTHQ